MSSKRHIFVKNFSYTIIANISSLLISTLIVLIMPRLIGIKDYGYWQLYLFYASYVGFLHFGWNDGIYLRFGGEDYNNLNKGLFFSQFWMLAILQLIIASIIIVFSLIFVHEVEKQLILIMVAFCMILMDVRGMPLYILQVTNRIKEYAQVIIIGRIIYFCLISVFLLVGIRAYKLIIVADLIGKFISLLYAMYCCRDIIFRKISSFYFSFGEALENINVGSKLMLANISSMLIIGVVRLGIERSWDVSTFGKVSLTLSVSNLMMLFINAIGIVIFPLLRRTNENKLPSIYIIMRDFLMVILLGILILYYPLKVVLSSWLPKYADSLMYMALVFPMCVYEGKMALLINTYLKTLREEKMMLKINLVTLTFSVIITYLTTIIYKNLNLTIASILFILAFRCVLAEIIISRILAIYLYKDVLLELSITLIFVLTGWFINSWFTVLLYGIAYVLYLIIKRKDIIISITNLKLLMKNDE